MSSHAKLFFLILLFFSGRFLFSQQVDSIATHKDQRSCTVPMQRIAFFENGPRNCHIERSSMMDVSSTHSSIQPYGCDIMYPVDSMGNKLKDEDTHITIKTTISPVVNLTGNYNLSHSSFFLQSYIGFQSVTEYSDKLALSVTALTGSSGFPDNIDSTIKNTHMVPGMGPAYGSGNSYSYQYYAGYLSYSPNRIFNFQIGKDKHFWGDGYRSLFLSDVSNSYPFAQISTTIWHIKYVSMYAMLPDASASNGTQADFKARYGTFHYLSWNVCRWLNFGFFETVIFQGTDNNRVRNFDVNYLNPVIFYRPIEYSLGSSDNVLIGLSFKLKLFKKQQFYGQLILDEFLLKEVLARNGWWANKQGFQAGFKSSDLFKVHGLSFQTEFNYVRPYTYTHATLQQNYSNMNQPLAHPLGANFMESVSFLTYKKDRWLFEGKALAAVYGADSAGLNFGHNIFISYNDRPAGRDYGNYITQGLKTTLLIGSLKASYLLLPKYNLRAEAGFNMRIESSTRSTITAPYVFIGIKTSLMNFYDDF